MSAHGHTHAHSHEHSSGVAHAPTSGGRFGRAARGVVIAPIVFYQRFISPGIPRRCRYEPTCSRYGVQAIQRYGILRGLVLAVWRLLRCNPWSPGGFDPVEAQTMFAPRVEPPPG
jgi:putative membrane protein insertion efficiency factor